MNVALDRVRRYRLSVADYHKMAEAGVFPEGARVELIEGEIYDMPPIGTRHMGMVNRLNELFVLATAGQATVSVQNPVVLGDYSEPEPDFAVLRRREDFYAGTPAFADDVLLVVEVAESSLRHDTVVKAPLYARHGIPEYWLIDAEHRRLIVLSDPGPDDYRDEITMTEAGVMTPIALPDVAIDLTGLF